MLEGKAAWAAAKANGDPLVAAAAANGELGGEEEEVLVRLCTVGKVTMGSAGGRHGRPSTSLSPYRGTRASQDRKWSRHSVMKRRKCMASE